MTIEKHGIVEINEGGRVTVDGFVFRARTTEEAWGLAVAWAKERLDASAGPGGTQYFGGLEMHGPKPDDPVFVPPPTEHEIAELVHTALALVVRAGGETTISKDELDLLRRMHAAGATLGTEENDDGSVTVRLEAAMGLELGKA